MSRKKLLLVGFIIVILIAIPVTIFLVKQQQETRSRAEKATALSFEPSSLATSPLKKNIDDIVNLDVFVDPGVNQNLVSFVRLEILYDPAKLLPRSEGDTEKTFTEEASAMSLLEGPVYTPGKIVATLSVGVDITKAIQTKTKIATISLKAIDGTGDTPTEVSFGRTTQVLSAGNNDSANENILNFDNTLNAFVAIAGPVTNPTASPTASLTISITPSIPPSVATPTATITPSPTIIGSTGTPNSSPVCSALTVDRSTTGNAPFSITFTASGTDSDGTISKVTFSYGDGQVENVTQGGGISTSTVNAGAAHTYQNAGSYTASVILTDNGGGVSSGNCTQAIDVQAAGTSSSGESTASNPTSTTDIASLPPTGPGDTILGLGAIVGVLTFIGAAVFFVL